jgi:hypothetical protein
MAQPPTQDLLNNVDYTVFPRLSAAELNLGFSQLVPNTNGTINDGSVGVGGMVFTADTALNTPQVPNAATIGGTPKWQGYLWIRIPFSSTAGTVAPIGYFWNNSKGNDATFLKWQSTQVDLTAVNAAITALQAAVTTAQTTATAANNTANTALTNSAAAQTTATAANNTANAAATASGTALTNAATALTAANSATSTANAANATANAAAAAVAAIGASSFKTGNIPLNAIGVGSAIINLPHGLGATPSIFSGVLVCQNTENGYNPGDEVNALSCGGYSGAGVLVQQAFFVSVTSANVFMTQTAGVTSIGIINKTTGALGPINPANWQAKIYARL